MLSVVGKITNANINKYLKRKCFVEINEINTLEKMDQKLQNKIEDFLNNANSESILQECKEWGIELECIDIEKEAD